MLIGVTARAPEGLPPGRGGDVVVAAVQAVTHHHHGDHQRRDSPSGSAFLHPAATATLLSLAPPTSRREHYGDGLGDHLHHICPVGAYCVQQPPRSG